MLISVILSYKLAALSSSFGIDQLLPFPSFSFGFWVSWGTSSQARSITIWSGAVAHSVHTCISSTRIKPVRYWSVGIIAVCCLVPINKKWLSHVKINRFIFLEGDQVWWNMIKRSRQSHQSHLSYTTEKYGLAIAVRLYVWYDPQRDWYAGTLWFWHTCSSQMCETWEEWGLEYVKFTDLKYSMIHHLKSWLVKRMIFRLTLVRSAELWISSM